MQEKENLFGKELGGWATAAQTLNSINEENASSFNSAG